MPVPPSGYDEDKSAVAVPEIPSSLTPGAPAEGGAAKLSPDELIGDRYVVIRRLGAGGMGEAWLAEDRVLHRKLVLKRLTRANPANATQTGQVLSEAKRSTAINSPHIAQVFDVCSHNGEWLLAMEYVAGQDLRTLLAAPMDAATFFSLAVQIAEAIQAAHTSSILHCDIKPENIMVTEQGFVKVLDFGLARLVAAPASGETVSLAASGAIFAGTPGYMAPEVLRESTPTEQSDIFSLGVVLYEMTGGKQPFRGKTTADSLLLTLTSEPAPLDLAARGLPEDLQRIVMKALNKQPERRYATVRDLLVDLKSLQQQNISGIFTAPRSTNPRRSPKMTVAVGVLGFALTVVSIAFTVRDHNRRIASRANVPAAASPIPAAPQTRVLAVLPFHVIGPAKKANDADMSAYTEGLREAITASLAKAGPSAHFEVLAASEVRAHALTTPDEAHKELGADLVIDGSYQQVGNRVQIMYELSGASGTVINSGSLLETVKDPFALENHVVAGVLQMLSVESAGVEQATQRFGTENPTAYDAYLRGVGYLRDFQVADSLKNAVASFEQATHNDPRFAAAWAGLGEAHWAEYQAEANVALIAPARASCAQATKLGAGIAEAQICQATIDDGTGKVQQAQAEYQKALDLDPQSDTALHGLARTWEQLEHPEQAQHVYEQAIRARPYYWANYYGLANFFVRRANYAQAAQVLQDAVQKFPENSFLARRLGAVYLLQGQFASAGQVLQQAIREAPHADAYMDLGQVYLHQNQYPQAIEALETAARISPNEYSVEADLADAYAWSATEKSKAKARYRKALDLTMNSLEVNPQDLDALMVAAYSSAALGDQVAALQYLDRALRHAPEDAEVNFYAARVHARLGDMTAARQWAEKAVAHGYSRADIGSGPDLAQIGAEIAKTPPVH
jgi:serine/threonine protein kinase/tetratricopeptide (TPR) repeat protein